LIYVAAEEFFAMKYKSLVLAAATVTAGTLSLGTETANAMTVSGVFGIASMRTNIETVGWHHGGHHWWHHGGHHHGGYWGGTGLWLGAGLFPFSGGYYGGYGGYGDYGDYYGDYGGYGDYYGGYYEHYHCTYDEHINTYCH
jgi:hypothetical protein